MKTFIKSLTVWLIIVFTLVPGGIHLVKVVSGATGLSLNENRYLNKWPKLNEVTDPVKYTKRIERYINDNFGFRTQVVWFYTALTVKFGSSGPVIRGNSSNWLFLQSRSIWLSYKGNNPFSQLHIERWIENLADLKRKTGTYGAAFAMIIPPNKARVYPENVPKRYGQPAVRRFVHTVFQHPKAAELGLRDVESMLLQAKQQYAVYYQTDTHWTTTGAYEGYLVAMGVFNQQAREFPVLNRNTLKIKERKDYSGDLAGLKGQKGKILETVLLRTAPPTDRKFTKTNIDDNAGPGAWQTSVFSNEISTGYTLVIVGDSFADATIPYFKHSFDKIVLIQSVKVGFHEQSVLQKVKSFRPDAVLFVAVERNAEYWQGFAD